MSKNYRYVYLGVFVTLVAVASCSSGSGGGGMMTPGISASITASTSGSGANFVRVVQGSASGDVVTLNVRIGGPTTNTDIYAFSFDLVLGNATLVQYQSGSASVGGALATAGCAGAEALATQIGDRIVVGVTKLGICAGNAVPGGEQTVVSLTLRVSAVGSTTVLIAGSPGNPQNPAMNPTAFDSSGSVIGSISFDTAAATVRGM